jgi:hypothetical protein
MALTWLPVAPLICLLCARGTITPCQASVSSPPIAGHITASSDSPEALEQQPSSVPAAPASEPQYPVITFGTLTYLQYDEEIKNRDNFNAFDITRGYINVFGDLAKNIKFRITPDVRRVTDSSLAGSVALRIKYAFVEFDNLLTSNSWLRFGAHQTPWLDFEESINRYRAQGKMFSEREAIIPASADFGVGYLTHFPSNRGELQVGVYNGEGYDASEVNKYKSVQGRVTLRPFPQHDRAKGLLLSAFYDLGWYAKNQPRRHGIAMGSYCAQHLFASLQWLAATERPDATTPTAIDRKGYSGFLELRQGMEGWAVFGRFDHLDQNTVTPDSSDRRIIAGVAYWLKWSKVRLGIIINDEDVRYEAGLKKADENRIQAITHIQF